MSSHLKWKQKAGSGRLKHRGDSQVFDLQLIYLRPGDDDLANLGHGIFVDAKRTPFIIYDYQHHPGQSVEPDVTRRLSCTEVDCLP